MTRSGLRGVVLGLCLLLGAAPALAEAKRDAKKREAEARALAGEGQAAYNLGEYAKAIDFYKRAYELAHRPALLFNLAQAYRLSQNPERAKFFYLGFLREMPDAPNRAEVEGRIQEMDAALAAAATPEPSPSPEPSDDPKLPVDPTPIPSPVVVAEAAEVPAATPRDTPAGSRPIYKRWWFWTGIGAVVVAGAAVAIVATSGSDTPSGQFGPAKDLF